MQHQSSLLPGILPINNARRDILAGLTLAMLAIPEVMGYTKIAGTPFITGLYTMMIPVILFAVLGGSRHLVVGADSATAAMMAVGLTGLASTGSPEYLALAGVLALLCGALLLTALLLKLGFLANFLSRTVLIGFLTGVGIQVALGQISSMLGIHGARHGPFHQLLYDWQQIDSVQPYALTLSVAVVLFVIGARRISRRFPAPLIAVVLAIFISWVLDLDQKGVAIIGTIPGGLPDIALPQVEWSWSLFKTLLPIAAGMVIVILAQSAATSRAYADRYGETVREDRDLLGLAAANWGAAFSGTFVVNGSPTKTQMVDSAGGRSQLAQLTAAFFVFLVLLFFTGPLSYLPEAVLASIVFLIGLELIDLKGMKDIYAQRPWEFWVAFTTAAVVLFVGVEQGVLMAIVLSLIVHTRHGYHPKNRVVFMHQGQWQTRPVAQHQQASPGLMIYRFNHSMYYANCTQLVAEVEHLIDTAKPALRWFCFDCSVIDDIDYSAAAKLRQLNAQMRKDNICTVFAAASEDVLQELARSGFKSSYDDVFYFSDISQVLSAYKALDAIPSTPGALLNQGDGDPANSP